MKHSAKRGTRLTPGPLLFGAPHPVEGRRTRFFWGTPLKNDLEYAIIIQIRLEFHDPAPTPLSLISGTDRT